MASKPSAWVKAKDLAIQHGLTIVLGFLTAVFTTIGKTNTLAEKVDHMVPLEVHRAEWQRIDEHLNQHDHQIDHIVDRVDRIWEKMK